VSIVIIFFCFVVLYITALKQNSKRAEVQVDYLLSFYAFWYLVQCLDSTLDVLALIKLGLGLLLLLLLMMMMMIIIIIIIIIIMLISLFSKN